jgi:hypothetical protein
MGDPAENPEALVIFLRGTAGDQLHALRDNVRAGISEQKVNVVARHRVVEHVQTKAFFRLENHCK